MLILSSIPTSSCSSSHNVNENDISRISSNPDVINTGNIFSSCDNNTSSVSLKCSRSSSARNSEKIAFDQDRDAPLLKYWKKQNAIKENGSLYNKITNGMPYMMIKDNFPLNTPEKENTYVNL